MEGGQNFLGGGGGRTPLPFPNDATVIVTVLTVPAGSGCGDETFLISMENDWLQKVKN